MARAIDTASIVFGLVSVPVKIFSTSERSHEIHFHLVHAGCGQRVHQKYACPKHGDVERSELAKGYPIDRTHAIELAPAELKALDAVATDEIALVEFVPRAAVDPIYVEATYYLAPDKGGERAYRLLRDVLEASELAGIAMFAARGASHLVMVRPFETGLAMHQLRYADEVKPWHEVGVGGGGKKPTASELELAKQLVAHLEHRTFDPSNYDDEVKARVKKLLDDKVKHGTAIEAPQTEAAPAISDLMAALRASLASPKAAAKPAHRIRRARSSVPSRDDRPEHRVGTRTRHAAARRVRRR
nr:Ku protein [Kofleriaceae bacterium]